MNNTELTTKVWECIKGSAAKAKKFEDNIAVSFSLLSEDNEDIYVAVRDGNMMVEPYPYNDNNCCVEATADTIAKMFSGEISFDKAISEGMIQIKSGDAAKLKALECLVPSKKTAAKSTKTAAKTETKSTAKSETKSVKTETKAAKEEPKAAAKAEAKTEAKEAAKPAKEEAKPAAKTEAKPAAKAPAKSSGAKKSTKKK